MSRRYIDTSDLKARDKMPSFKAGACGAQNFGIPRHGCYYHLADLTAKQKYGT
jgi:hypothetical protein